MTFKTRRALKISAYSALTLIVLCLILFTLIFSTPLCMNAYINSLVKYGNLNQSEFDFQSYTREEFAQEFLNTSFEENDDLIELFESEYGNESKKDGILIVYYNIPDPEKSDHCILIGINKYTDFVYTNSRQQTTFFDTNTSVDQV